MAKKLREKTAELKNAEGFVRFARELPRDWVFGLCELQGALGGGAYGRIPAERACSIELGVFIEADWMEQIDQDSYRLTPRGRKAKKQEMIERLRLALATTKEKLLTIPSSFTVNT
jgi:hypothetical protein